MIRSIVIAVFVKDDLIQAQIDNLLSLEKIDTYRVVFYQDNTVNSPKYDTLHYSVKLDKVKAIIEENIAKFKKAVFLRNDTNIHPYGICKKAMDYALIESGYAIFMEDDVFLAKNALHWFDYFYDTHQLNWDTCKFVTGESIFYDTQRMDKYPSKEQLVDIRNTIASKKYQQYFIELNNFLTSSIFATTREIWNTEIRDLRGSKNGECALNDAIKKYQWRVIFPVVPFAKDIGMQHEDGWSVAWGGGKENVKEIKNTYLMADEFETPKEFTKKPENFCMSLFYPKIL